MARNDQYFEANKFLWEPANCCT